MRVILNCFYFINHHNILIALAGGCLTLGIASHWQIKQPIAYSLLVTFLIFGVYTLQRLIDTQSFQKQTLGQFIKKNRTSLFASAISILLATSFFVSVFNGNIVLLASAGIFALFSYWYTGQLANIKLREIPALKIVIISSTWIYACVCFPLLNEGYEFTEIAPFTLLVFLYITATILPFDIRDLATDDLHQCTLPQLIGTTATKIVGTIFLLFFWWGMYAWEHVAFKNYLFAATMIGQLALLLAAHHSKKIVYFGLIDLLIGVMGLSLLL